MTRLAALVLVLCLAAPVGSSAADGGWSLRQLPPERVSSGFETWQDQRPNLYGISCPTKSLCVAVGNADTVAFSQLPGGGAERWHLFKPYDLAAEADRTCTGGPENPQVVPCTGPPDYRQVRAISCPSPGLCVAVTFDGYVYSSTDPTDGGSWRVADVDGDGRDTHLESVSCPDPSLCVAVSGNRYTAGKVLSSTDPAGGATAWKVVQLDESLDLRGVSCASRSFCLAVGENGRVVASRNPTGGAEAWQNLATPGGPGDLEGASCLDAAPSFCAAGNAGGNLLTSSTPDSGGWRSVNAGGSVQITGVDCISSSRCVAVDDNGDVMTSTDPTGGPGSWSFQNLVPYEPPEAGQPPLNALFGLSCATESLCALVGADARIFTSDDPFSLATPASAGAAPRHLVKRPRTVLLRADAFHNVTRHRRFHARFRFHAIGRATGFVCKRDAGPYRRCHSPLRYWVPIGQHVLRVRAIGPTGLRGPAAIDRFRAIRNPAFG